ncbi:TPA: restriction endonuclease subunit S [Streptococcus suis]
MPNKDRNIPKRRFKEFENADAWELRKLGEVANFSKGNGYSKKDLVEEGSPIILYGRLYTRYETVISEIDTFVLDEENRSNTVFSEGGEVLVPASGESALDIARASVVSEKGIVLGGDLNIIRLISEISPIFLALTISNGKTQKELSKRAQGKSVVHLHNSDLKEVEFMVPSLPEQSAIGTFFSTLDQQITLHQRKLDKLKNVKQAYLSEMFPAEGERVPKRRFPGFTDAWELRKLGEVAEIITGTTPSTFDEENYGGKRLFVSPVDIQDNRYITETLTTLTEKGHLLGRELRPGATLFVSIGSTIGKVAQLKDFATSNQQINAVISGDKIDDDFIFTGLEKKSAQIKNLSSQQAVPIINKSTFSNIEFEFPTLPEQKAIGTFFSTLDRQTTLHQRKLEKLKNLKKALLNELFV